MTDNPLPFPDTRRQNELKSPGRPWEPAKALEQSAPLALLQPLPPGMQPNAIEFECRVNDNLRQHGHTANLLFSIARLINIVSQTWGLGPQDLVFTGTPGGVGPVTPGDRIRLDSTQLGSHTWELI
jgi:2-keto-4-pentenoate hydratase/2-oxohepta-3-ene-1,7-dioic acid hydratase in catechol pathway